MDMSLVVRIALQVIRDGVPQLVSIYRSLAYYWYCGTRIILFFSVETFFCSFFVTTGYNRFQPIRS